MSIIGMDRSIIPACDVDAEHYRRLVEATSDLEKVGAYKIGAALALSVGLPRVVEIARGLTGKPLIYDHQKAGTDVPDTSEEFVRVLKECGIDALIIFPLSGPETQHALIQSAHAVNLPVIVGGHMTHDRYLRSQGGYIADEAVEQMFSKAAADGVNDYVVPGNKPDVIRHLRELVEQERTAPAFYSPGLIAQGGAITDAAVAAGQRWHAIVGRAIYAAADMREAAQTLSSQI